VHLDQQLRVANQTGRPLTTIVGGDQLANGNHFVADTLGGKLPTSLLGNTYVIQWLVLDSQPCQRLPYVTFNADHSAASSIRGLKRFVYSSGLDYNSNKASVTQDLTFHADNGTEFKGIFENQL
jgi:hypothetical protein